MDLQNASAYLHYSVVDAFENNALLLVLTCLPSAGYPGLGLGYGPRWAATAPASESETHDSFRIITGLLCFTYLNVKSG